MNNLPSESSDDPQRVHEMDLVAKARARVERLESELQERVEGLAEELELLLDDLDRRERESLERLREAAVQESKTRRQRQQIAAQLRARKAEQAAELLSAQLQHQTASPRHAPHAEDPALQSELKLQRHVADRALAEAERLQVELNELRQKTLAAQSELDKLREERDDLVERVESNGESVNQDSDLQRRYEMAVEDIRRLQGEVEELREQQESMASHSSDSLGCFDWEAQKQRMMSELDGGDDSLTEKEKRDVRSAIEATEQLVAEKDRQIEELRARLQNLDVDCHEIGDMAIAATEVVDADALVQQERAKLQELQQKWEEKLRKSEIEISVERAKLAREKSHLEDRIAAHEEERKFTGDKPSGGSDGQAKTSCSRWLARLGLADDD